MCMLTAGFIIRTIQTMDNAKRHRQVVEFVCPKDVDIFTLDILRA